jgi:energy-coupling factor transport system ATP-binding protein
VLATRPRVLVLDEPTFGQDARTWTELVELLLGLLGEGVTAIVATHDEALVAALGDRVLRLGLRVSERSERTDEQSAWLAAATSLGEEPA